MVKEVQKMFSGMRKAVLSAEFPKLKKKRSSNAKRARKKR